MAASLRLQLSVFPPSVYVIKEKPLCEKYILCYKLKNIHYICGI